MRGNECPKSLRALISYVCGLLAISSATTRCWKCAKAIPSPLFVRRILWGLYLSTYFMMPCNEAAPTTQAMEAPAGT